MLAIATAFGFVAQNKIGVAEQAGKNAIQFLAKADEAEQKRKQAEKQTESVEAQAKQANQQSKVAVQREAAATQQYKLAKTQAEQAQQETKRAQLATQQARTEQTHALFTANIARQREVSANAQVVMAKTELSKARELELLSKVESANTLFGLNQNFEALLESLRAAQLLKSVGEENPVSLDAKFETAIALNKAAYGIREKNRLPILLSRKEGSILFSPDNQTIAYTEEEGGRDRGVVRVWNTSGKEIIAFKDKDFRAFSSDSKIILTALMNGLTFGGTLVKLSIDYKDYNLASLDGKAVKTPKGKLLSISKERDLIAVFNDKKTIQIWDLATQVLKATLQFSVNEDTDVSFSPDSQLIATSNKSGTTALWDANGKLLQSFKGRRTLFSPNTNSL